MSNVEQITAREAAGLYVLHLQRRGAKFTLNEHNDFHCDLDSSDCASGDEAEHISQCLFAMRDEVRAVLRSVVRGDVCLSPLCCPGLSVLLARRAELLERRSLDRAIHRMRRRSQ